MDDIAIKVSNVSKTFKLPHEKASTVKHLFINFHKSRKGYEKQKVLEHINLEIKKGEFFGIVGRNGSGKSTLLKLLAGIYSPDAGHIQTNGKLVPFIELGVGFNPQLTGRENVYLNGALLGFSDKEIDSFYKEVIEFAELERFMDQKLKNYSSGMQVRLAFAMAVQAKADVLLLDEILAVGDADFQRKCFEYFKKLKKDKKTVVFVSHNMNAIREYCDVVALIEKGKIVVKGSPEKVTQAYIRQFNKGKNKKEFNNHNSDKRWGNNIAENIEIEVSVTKKSVVILQKVKANKDIGGYIAGIKIKSADNKSITGTNTKIEKLSTGGLKKGERSIIRWEVPNIFADGRYIIDPALHAEDGVTVFDWWEDAMNFTVKRDRRLPYNIDPGINVSIKAVHK